MGNKILQAIHAAEGSRTLTLAETLYVWLVEKTNQPNLVVERSMERRDGTRRVFVRVNNAEYSAIYSKTEYANGAARWDGLDFAGVVVDGQLYNSCLYDLRYELDHLEQKGVQPTIASELYSFYHKTLDDVEKHLVYAVTTRLAADAEKAFKAGSALSAEDDAEAHEAAEREATDLLLYGKTPELSHPKVQFGDDGYTAIRYLRHGLAVVDEVVNRIKASEKWNGWVYTRAFYEYTLVEYARRQDKANPSEKATLAIVDALKTAKESGAKTVKILIDAKDEEIPSYTRNNFPDFSFGGKPAEGKLDVDARIDFQRGITSWYFKPTNPVLKKPYSNKYADLFDYIRAEQVISITYGKKTLYARENAATA